MLRAGIALSLRDQRYLIRVKAGLLAAATKKYNEALTEATDLVAQLRAQGVSENFLIAGFAEVDLNVPEPERTFHEQGRIDRLIFVRPGLCRRPGCPQQPLASKP